MLQSIGMHLLLLNVSHVLRYVKTVQGWNDFIDFITLALSTVYDMGA